MRLIFPGINGPNESWIENAWHQTVNLKTHSKTHLLLQFTEINMVLLFKDAFLWDDLDQYHWSQITRIMVDQMNWWILVQSGFISSFDLLWSGWSGITDPDPDHLKGTHPKAQKKKISIRIFYKNIFRLIDRSLHSWIILHLWGFLCIRDAGCRGNKINGT